MNTVTNVLAIPQVGAPVTVGHLRIARRPEGTYFGKMRDGKVALVAFKSALPKIPLNHLAAVIDILQKCDFGESLSIIWSANGQKYYLGGDDESSKGHVEDIVALRVVSAGDLPTSYLSGEPKGSETGLTLYLGRLHRPAPEMVLTAGLEGVFSDIPVFGLFQPLPPRDAA